MPNIINRKSATASSALQTSLSAALIAAVIAAVAAISAILTNASQQTQIVDASANVIGAELGTDGHYQLHTNISQNIYADPNNSSTTNLDSGNAYTFTGASTSTLGVTGLQWSLRTDQNATVYIEQSPDNTNWDISDNFDYKANEGLGGTVQATQSYWRIRVILVGAIDTTYFRLQGVLAPIAVPLPSALSNDGRLLSESTLTGQQNTNRHVWVNPTNELAVSPVYRLVGTSFDGTVLDPNFWTDGSLRDGTVAQGGGEIKLETNTTANGFAKYTSVRKARFVAGSAQYFNGAVSWVTAGTANNLRRVGVYTTDVSDDIVDGYFFQLDETVFSIGYARAGTPVLVDSGDFNGNLGATFTPTAATYYLVSIEYTPMGAFWYIDGKLLHKIGAAHLSNTNTLPIVIENENTGNSIIDVVFDTVGLYIARQGELITSPISSRATGVSGTVFKYGAGNLRGMQVSTIVDNAEVDIYDGLSNAGTLIWASGKLKKKDDGTNLQIDFWNLPFNDGLFIDITVQSADVLVVYE